VVVVSPDLASNEAVPGDQRPRLFLKRVGGQPATARAIAGRRPSHSNAGCIAARSEHQQEITICVAKTPIRRRPS